MARDHMRPDEFPVTLTTFPLLGVPHSLTPDYAPSGPRLRSQFVPDEIANPHIRFPTLAANIRARRGAKVALNVPVFRDTNTPQPFRDPTVDYDRHDWPEDDDVRRPGVVRDNCIYMDAMAFGMGSCCLQITFQAQNIAEGRTMYDQLSPLGPILLALTAATPIYKGFLADTDVRWNQISDAVDDRTPEERGEAPLRHARWRIPKSRYASNSTYIAQDPRLRPEYLDPELVVDEGVRARLTAGGMDDALATHFAHLFIRDPLVVFAEDLHHLNLDATDHFENLQSTNWQHMRFKPPPPPPAPDTGWRVEVRPMEIQLTDFENAAFAVFVVLVTRAILSFDLNFYLPIPLTTHNMHVAHRRDAVTNDRFHFRRDPSSSSTSPIALLTIHQIINGDPHDSGFPGLLPLVESYLDSINCDVESRCRLARYLALVRDRASGRLPTAARWLRGRVRAHPEYRGDSAVSPRVAYDLVRDAQRLAVHEGRDGFGTDLLGLR